MHQIEINERTASSMCGLGVLTCTTAPGLRAASPQSNPKSNPQKIRGFGCGIAGSQSKSAASLRAASLLRATATQLESMPMGSRPRSSSCRASASAAAPCAPCARALSGSTARPPPPRAWRSRLARTRLRVRRPRHRACASGGGPAQQAQPWRPFRPVTCSTSPAPSQRTCTKTASSVMTRNMFRTWPAAGWS